MARVLGRSLCFALLLSCALPARAAEPIVMFLLGIARDMAINAIARAPAAPVEVPEVYAGTTVQPAQLRQLIQDSFHYLSEEQRNEVFESLNAELVKPRNAPIRASMIEYFGQRALLIRAAQRRLALLSPAEMQQLAAEFGRETRELPPEEVEKLRHTLEQNLLPVPPDLNRRLLAALG